MSLRDDALSDILAATSSEVLGQGIVIDGKPFDAVKKSLTTEEMVKGGFDGVSTEGIRITISLAALGYAPENGRSMDIDGVVFTAGPVSQNGDRLRITLSRYIS